MKSELFNREKVVALQRSIETHDPTPIQYINPDKYIQHNINVADGLEAILALHELLPADTTKARPVRAFQDGDFTVVHVEYNLWGPKAGFDIHRFENHLIVEHWDNLQEMPASPNPSGRTMLDGQTEIKDHHLTETNKAFVQRFVQEVLVEGDWSRFKEYFQGEELIQHNPMIGDGVSSYFTLLKDGASPSKKIQYKALHKVLGEGNFVLTLSEGFQNGNHVAFYDLFRVEGGKLAEHWDVIEEIPAPKDWKNSNGKF